MRQIQIHQVRLPRQRREIGDVLHEQFDVFQILQLRQRRNIRDRGFGIHDDQPAQLRPGLQKAEIADIVVAQIQRQQTRTVFLQRTGHVLGGIAGFLSSLQRGEGGHPGADFQAVDLQRLCLFRPRPRRKGAEQRQAEHDSENSPAHAGFPPPFRFSHRFCRPAYFFSPSILSVWTSSLIPIPKSSC